MKVKRFGEFVNEGRGGNKITNMPEFNKTDRIIMTAHKSIIPRNVDQRKHAGWDNNGIGMKPAGLWYSFGSEWIDWVRGNMPDWEDEYIHKITINKSKILNIDKYGWDKFENEFGVTNNKWSSRDVITDIAWDYVQEAGWYGVETMHPWGDIGSWSRSWDVSSGCIWDKRGIKKIELLN